VNRRFPSLPREGGGKEKLPLLKKARGNKEGLEVCSCRRYAQSACWSRFAGGEGIIVKRVKGEKSGLLLSLVANAGKVGVLGKQKRERRLK